MALYIGNNKYKPMFGGNKASFMIKDMPYDTDLNVGERYGFKATLVEGDDINDYTNYSN